MGLLRLAVIVVGSVSYPLLAHAGTMPWLAYSVLGVAWVYCLAVLAFRPYIRFPGLASPLYTTVSDSVLLMLWVYATGGYDSPYWAIMFLSVLAIAYRFSLRPALAAWGVYAVLYAAVVTALGQWPGHADVVFVRLSYLGIGATVAGLIATQSLETGREKFAMAAVAETERRLRDEANRSLSLLAATLDSTADGLLVVDLEGRITRFNRRFAELWRLPPDVLASKSDEAALRFAVGQLQDPDGFLRKVQELYGSPMAESFDTLQFKDARVFERFSRPQLIADKPVGRVWSFRDVSERVRAEREREANRARAEELDRLKAIDAFKSQFINTAAHELNTPLTPIILQMHMIKPAMEAADPRTYGILLRNVNRLADLVSDLLDAAKYPSGKLVLENQPLDLARLAAECVESFQELASRAQVRLVADAAEPVSVQADARRVSQVLYNLVGNAVKFTPAGGVVEVGVEALDGMVTVRVSDSGIGLSPEAMTRLFLPFSQLHGGTHSGTGLGLYICKGIVEAHGGTIRCHSEGLGKGTTFTFTLPRVSPAA